MLKKFFIGLLLLAVLIIVAFFYLNNRNRTLSPQGEAELTNAGFDVSITYSRPSVRDRLIFGEKEEGALLPYGYYWRLGANEPTLLTVSSSFKVAGKEIPAGTYTLYAFPRKGEMELRLNSETNFWGTMEPEEGNDVAAALVRMDRIDKTEQFTIILEKVKMGVNVVFQWDNFRWELPIEKS